MKGVSDRNAYFLEVISYCEPNKEPVSFVSKTIGSISTEKRGEYGWSFDKIFIPQGEEKTLAEFKDDERWKFWSKEGYIDLKNFIMCKDK